MSYCHSVCPAFIAEKKFDFRLDFALGLVYISEQGVIYMKNTNGWTSIHYKVMLHFVHFYEFAINQWILLKYRVTWVKFMVKCILLAWMLCKIPFLLDSKLRFFGTYRSMHSLQIHPNFLERVPKILNGMSQVNAALLSLQHVRIPANAKSTKMTLAAPILMWSSCYCNKQLFVNSFIKPLLNHLSPFQAMKSMPHTLGLCLLSYPRYFELPN